MGYLNVLHGGYKTYCMEVCSTAALDKSYFLWNYKEQVTQN